MEGETTTPNKTTPKTTPTKTTPTTTSTPSLIGSNWPSLPIPGDTTEAGKSQDSPIQRAQKSPTAWKGQQRGPEEYEKDRVGRFAKYFKGNEILPIPEIADKIAPRVLSLVVSDLKTKRLVGLTKEVFEELIRKAGIPCQYFCHKSFATWDVLLPTEKQAAKTAESDITTKHFRLQPEYKGTRRLRVTVCNVPAIITGEVLAAYLSAYGNIEEFNLLRSPAGTAYRDYAFRLCLKRWFAGIGRWWWWWREDAPGAGGANRLDISQSFAPSDLKIRKKRRQQQQQKTRRPPPSPKKRRPRARVRSSPKTTRRAGLKWPKRGGEPLNKGVKKVQIHPLLKNKPRPKHKQQQ